MVKITLSILVGAAGVFLAYVRIKRICRANYSNRLVRRI
jgi:hypothetical protein